MFLILLTACSTYYLHWQNLPTTGSGSLRKTRFLEPVEPANGPRLVIKSTGPVADVSSEPVVPIDIAGPVGPVDIVGPIEPLTGPVAGVSSEPVVPIDIAGPAGLLEPKIVVAVPTCNRIGYVQLTSSVLRQTFDNIWVFDDRSSEYGYKELIKWYATNNVFVTKKHLKSDAMARHILEWFVKTEYDILVLLDSDLVVAPDWLESLKRGLRESTGLLSLYRSAAPKHKSLSCGDVLCQQPSMGNAGTVWRRDLAKRMLAEMSARDGGFDWGWSEWCTKNKVPMEALKKSAVLHIGMYGSWSHESTAEKSVGFPMQTLSADVRQRAEHFLKGAKPTHINIMIKDSRINIAAVVHLRFYRQDKAQLGQQEMLEWMDYMRYAGVSHFLVYDNGKDASEQFKDVIEPLNDATYHLWNKYQSDAPQSVWWADKLASYQHAADNYRQYPWQIAFDIDEVPFSPRDTERGFLGRLLKEYSEKHPDVSEFSFQNYGMLGEFTKKGHYFGRYTHRTKAPLNNLVKPIYKPSCIKAAFHHNHLTCGTNYNFDSKDIRMNHYWGARLQGFVGALPVEWKDKVTEDLSLLPILNRIYKDTLKGAIVSSEPTDKKPSNDILWVIPAFKRAWSLDLVLHSLSGREATNILVSKDADSDEIDAVLKKYTAKVINHPYSCSRHPNQFPAKDESLNENYKGDTYGNPRSPWATCLKHHWWWMMKQAWARKPERVCVLEDDTVIHPQAFEWLDKNKEGNVKLTPEEIAVPWCMSAKEWQTIEPKAFCEHDDYNWDQTIAWMFEHGHKNEAIVPSRSLSMHVGDCGGWDAGGRDKACTPEQIDGIRANVEHWLAKPVAINTIKKKWLTAHSKPNGGWGHPKDWAHCLGNNHPDISIHILTTGSRDISNLKTIIPHARIFKGSIGYDNSCKDILRDVGARFLNRYYSTLDYIEEGKLGHWCSNLRFARSCHGLCVLIEDDVIMNDEDVKQIYANLKIPFNTPILRLGEYDDINVWNSSKIWKIYEAVQNGIDNPTDLFFEKLNYYTKRGPIGRLTDPSHSSEQSIIRKFNKRIKLIDLQKAYKNDRTSINTPDLFAAIDYNAPENKGPWKQGWDYDYDGRFKDGLTVHVVPHSHNDPGWIQTYHTYYSTQTRHILDTVVAALTEDPRRTFIWAEISYFSLWWNDATQQQKEQAKKLVAEKRLDFVTGGWVMNDEASVTARATRWHLQEGREWLQNTFGITPQYSWAIDPFGHSAGQAQVLKELGYKGMLIQRVHYAVKKQLAQKQQLEFQWQTPAGEIFTHMMPFYSYDGPHTCGPDPSVCCQFDFARIGKGKTWTGCPWGKMAVEITDANVAERSRTWLDQVYKKAMLYRGKHVLIPVGDDFRYQTMGEAHKQFTNYQKMFDWIKVNIPSVSISFSTLSRYFDAVVQTQVPKLQGSFFPYSDREKDYWTGYFNSRIFYKGYDRLLESLIAAVEHKCPSVDIHLQKRAMGLFQHHDGITGTAKTHVVQDYYKTMQKAVIELKSKLKTCLDISSHVLINPLSVDTPTMNANEIRPYEEDACVSVPAAGLPAIKIDKHGNILQINKTPIHESLVWRSNKPGQGVAGAYLMSVTPKEDMLQPIKHTTCIAKQYKQVETTFDLLKRRIRVYNDGTIEFIYDVDIHARNNGELWAVYKPEWTAERLCSDVHGLTWECHIERKDAPLQAKFWPMPTMAWLASSSERLTFMGAQPTGVGFHEGAMVLMLDRRGNQDDARGLGQGITDSRPVEMRFGVLMESEDLKERASKKALIIRNWMLNPTIEIV